MDSAQAKARRFLTVREIFADLSKSEQSPNASVALLLLSLEAYKFDIGCPCDVGNDRLQVTLPQHYAHAFLKRATEGEDLAALVYSVDLWLEGGRWEIASQNLLDVLDPASGERYCADVPFAEFRVPRRELEERLHNANVAIPERWHHGDGKPITATNLNASKYDKKLQEFIDGIVRDIESPSLRRLWEYLKTNFSEATEGKDPNFDDIYVDGEDLCWIDGHGVAQSCSRRSLERYLRRAKNTA